MSAPTKRPAHRPRLDPACARVKLSARVHPVSLTVLRYHAVERGISVGRLIDGLILHLPAPVFASRKVHRARS